MRHAIVRFQTFLSNEMTFFNNSYIRVACYLSALNLSILQCRIINLQFGVGSLYLGASDAYWLYCYKIEAVLCVALLAMTLPADVRRR